MSQEIDIIQNILKEFKVYSSANANGSYADFVEHLHLKMALEPKNDHSNFSSLEVMKSNENSSANIAFHLTRLGKYAKNYIRAALKDSVLVSGEDFGFLASLMERKYTTKSELIAYNVQEIPSGMDIIKRLVRNGLVEEKIDPEDRRKKLLSITAAGRTEFIKISQQMQKVARIVVGDLNEASIQSLLILLRDLDHFHEKVYQQTDKYDIDKLFQTIADTKKS